MGGETCTPERAKRRRKQQADKVSTERDKKKKWPIRKYWPPNTGSCSTEMEVVFTFNHLRRNDLRRTICYGKYIKREWFELLTTKFQFLDMREKLIAHISRCFQPQRLVKIGKIMILHRQQRYNKIPGHS